ncbi:toll/interleukin-1 receptor (TIR) domain-containing protein [Artemisia annua]|uniref:Toll/interleukin-1 receptor (TIR) domain-containing protein n=1 Tax=Artemisia annua TaxID=35608 RepID=A0A2U1KL51_ARTAN|nr:toll/interleukin-1 receptor (TIR) domain-containing protein [Artemisia annua]
MASSSIEKSYQYDVFLSFRGEDTRKNFVDHLYAAFQQQGIHTFKDDKRLKKGKRIDNELIKSIEDSRFFIIVFSKNYASSSWCLDELVKIMECHKTTEQTAYPVFYDVEPSEVRKQSGAVADAFSKHEKEDAAGKWRDALEEAANLAGWELKNTADGHEAELIQKVVEEISLELRAINMSCDENLIGIETRIKDVELSLELGSDDVRMIGIKGMGGAGKTTLARAIFDQISVWFEGKSFVENVREVSKGTLSGLKSLQEKVLSDVLNENSIGLSTIHDGKKIMKTRLHGKKVLVILDDVDHIDQLEALAGARNWFKPGSRIIITTRDEQVLIAHRVNLIRDISLLSKEESVRLFSRYAFGREIPIQGYEELSQQVVRYAAGLPLTIKVLGSFLCGKNKLEWEDALKRLKKIPLQETLEKLELSYIGLEKEYKEIFLDVACFLKGRGKENAITMLEKFGFHARNGLRVLEQKSLITYGFPNMLTMHDHIEEMARDIIRREHPDEPSKHSRLWIEEEIVDVLGNDLGTEATRCIKVWRVKLSPELIMKGLGKMKNLRLLGLSCESKGDSLDNDWKFDEAGQYFSNALRYLEWRNYPYRSLPKTFEANNLVSLEMPFSQIEQLWEGGERKVLNSLKFLDLSHSMLTKLDLGMTPNLEMLYLLACDNLLELLMPLGYLNLKSLRLSLTKLRTISLRRFPSLEFLCLEGSCDDSGEHDISIACQKLRRLELNYLRLSTLDLSQTINLEYLDIQHSNLKTLNFGLTSKLETLHLFKCHDLVELHTPTNGFLKLTCLDLNGSKFNTLDLELIPNLESLILTECLEVQNIDIFYSKLKTIDLRLCSKLKRLTILECDDLVELHLPNEGCLKLGYFKLKGSKLSYIDLRLTPNLETLCLIECYNLVELQMIAELKFLEVYNSNLKILDLGQTSKLETLLLFNCDRLVELHLPINGCPQLTYLSLSNSKLKTLDLGLSLKLGRLNLHECRDLVELHMPINGCPILKDLELAGSKLRTLYLPLATNLQKLSLENCHDLVELYMPVVYTELSSLNLEHSKSNTLDLGMTPNLERLTLKRCHVLLELRMPINGCIKLTSINLSHSKLETLDLGLIPNLESLYLENCENLVELHMPIKGCSKLRSISLSHAKLETLDLGLTPNLEFLLLEDCYHLKNLRTANQFHLSTESLYRSPTISNHYLPNFRFTCFCAESNLYEKHILLSLCNCKNLNSFLESISEIRNFQLFKLDGSIWQTPKALDKIESLEELVLSSTEIKNLPDNICMLKCLKTLRLESRMHLEKLPEDIGGLKCLEHLHLLSTRIKHLPDSICMLKHLKSLTLQSCLLLEKLPEDLGRLECLEYLILTDCIFLLDIPNSICDMISLKCFRLPNCVLVEKLPEEIGNLECLKELNIEGTGIRHLPGSIFWLKGLRIIGAKWLLESYGFTSRSSQSRSSDDFENVHRTRGANSKRARKLGDPMHWKQPAHKEIGKQKLMRKPNNLKICLVLANGNKVC